MIRTRVSAQGLDRWRLTLPLAIPTLAGLAYLIFFGAPPRLIAVHAGALGAALAWVRWGRLPAGRNAHLILAAVATGLLFLPPLLNLEVGGVSRWLPSYPFLLHSGFLLLPLITAIAGRKPGLGPVMLALACAALAIQPDAGALLGLAAASAGLAAAHRSFGFALVAGASLTLALALFDAGTLQPERFTEAVLPHVWRNSPPLALLLGAVLFLVPAGLLLTGRCLARSDGIALAALLTGFGAAAVLGPFPYPLIGYGAAPILGFALALSVTRQKALSSC